MNARATGRDKGLTAACSSKTRQNCWYLAADCKAPTAILVHPHRCQIGS